MEKCVILAQFKGEHELSKHQRYCLGKIKPSTMEGFLVTQGISLYVPLLHHHTYILPPKILGVNFSFLDFHLKTNPNMISNPEQVISQQRRVYLVLMHKYSSMLIPRETKTRNFSVDSRRLCLPYCTLGAEEHP